MTRRRVIIGETVIHLRIQRQSLHDIPRCLDASSEPQSPVLQASTSCRQHSLAAGVLLHMLCAYPPLTEELGSRCLQQWNAANKYTMHTVTF